MTYLEARRQAAQLLAEAGVENEIAESGFLMEYVTDRNSSFYLLHQMDPMPEDLYERYMDVTKKRCTHIPLQYLTGEQEFMGLDFMVNEHVLIPRQDTETLVEKAIELLQADASRTEVLDMCTGSGCIAISVKHYCPERNVTGCDISAEALKVAAYNAVQNHTDINWMESDLFDTIEKKYDVIISNPPYIRSDVIPTLMPEVKDHEPMSALDGYEDGLYFYREIVKQSEHYLNDNGLLMFEIGYDQAEAVSQMMREATFKSIEVLKDPAGLDRVVLGRR